MHSMTQEEFDAILHGHKLWLLTRHNVDLPPEAKRAIFGGTPEEPVSLKDIELPHYANLQDADVSCVRFPDKANLGGWNFTGADLSETLMYRANLQGAKFIGANMVGFDGRGADFTSAFLTLADLTNAYMDRADLSKADLFKANLTLAKLNYTNLFSANLSYANLTQTDISEANLANANLTGVTGLLDPWEWLSDNFQLDKEGRGFIVYKQFGNYFKPPTRWTIQAGSVITEVVNPVRTTDCGSGVNFAIENWDEFDEGRDLWECLLAWRDLPSLVVPYHTSGKARVGRLTLLRVIRTKIPEPEDDDEDDDQDYYDDTHDEDDDYDYDEDYEEEESDAQDSDEADDEADTDGQDKD